MFDLKFKSNLISNVAVGRNRTTTNRTGRRIKNLGGEIEKKYLSLRVSSFLFLKNLKGPLLPPMLPTALDQNERVTFREAPFLP